MIEGIRCFFFHNLTSKDLTLDLSCTENTSSQSNSRGLLWEYGGGEKAGKKISAQYKKKIPSDGTAQRVGKQLAQWPYTLHLSFLVFRLSFWSIFQAWRPMAVRTFFLFHPHLHFQSAVKLHRRGLLFGFFLFLGFLFFWTCATVHTMYILLSRYSLFFSLLVVQDSKRQPCQLNRK